MRSSLVVRSVSSAKNTLVCFSRNAEILRLKDSSPVYRTHYFSKHAMARCQSYSRLVQFHDPRHMRLIMPTPQAPVSAQIWSSIAGTRSGWKTLEAQDIMCTQYIHHIQ